MNNFGSKHHIKILAIETSCDPTSFRFVLNLTGSQPNLHFAGRDEAGYE